MCQHKLGSLPCTNTNQHPGENDDSGRGCTHDAGSSVNGQEQD